MFIVLLIWGMQSTGTFSWNLEDTARKDGNIADDWVMESDKTGQIAAMLFYPEDGDGTEMRFSIYINPRGLSFGYFFTYGGISNEIEEGISCYEADEISYRAFLSMNRVRVARAVYGSGNSAQTVELNPDKPFALVLPSDEGAVTFYNDQDEKIEDIYDMQ